MKNSMEQFEVVKIDQIVKVEELKTSMNHKPMILKTN
jgi:hypothetical protein